MKVYIPESNELTATILQILKSDLEEVATIEESDFVLVTSLEPLRKHFQEGRIFFFLTARDFDRESSKTQPDNVWVIDGDNGLKHICAELARLRDSMAQAVSKPVETKTADIGPVAQMNRSYFVLVVDDTEANLQTAIERLPGQKLILARGPEEAMKYLNLPGQMPDAVLTDMQMRPDKLYGSLNVDQYGVTETIHNGFSMMFEATSRGIPVAIVTDGNHHQDWVSAMFNKVKSADVNGQKVLFFNNIGKRWETALKMLLEPEPVQE